MDQVKSIFTVEGIPFTFVDLNKEPWCREEISSMSADSNTLPQIFIDKNYLSGGIIEFQDLYDSGELSVY